MIDEEILNNHIDGFKEKLWYICGPPPMIDVMENILLKRNVPEKRIRYEKWMIPGKGD